MASGILHGAVSFLPAHLFVFELITSSAVVGLTAPTSVIRPLALPLITGAALGIIKSAVKHLRPRWASLLGGLSFAFVLRYLDVALITQWAYEQQGPTANIRSPNVAVTANPDQKGATPTPSGKSSTGNASVWTRLVWGWNTLWSFRQVNTPYEVRNTPTFSNSDSKYVPQKWAFVGHKTLLASVCYIVLDLLAQRPPPQNAAALFSPSLIPFFRRLSEVTWPQVRLRAISIVMFGVTFYCVIQGVYSLAAAISVALGLSDVRSWRPPFGAFTEAYSLRNFWGKVWHQQLRRLVGAPAAYIVSDVLGLDRKTVPAIALTTFLSFAISGIMHLAAGHTSGMPLNEMGVVQFFCTQAFGILLESATAQLLFGKANATSDKRPPPTLLQRTLGYFWVLAFLAWSGPMWLYPQAARQGPQVGSTSFVPYSIVQAWRTSYKEGILG